MEGSRSAKIFIYNHSNYYSENEGIDISGGYETNIALSKKISEMYVKPYSDCEIKDNVKLIPSSDSQFFDLFTQSPYKYRSADCHTVCYQELILNKCNCIDYSTIFFNIKNIQIPKLCNWDDGSADSVCFDNLFETTDIDTVCDKKCPYECDQVKVSFSTSFSALFTDRQTLKVNVYFNELSYEYSSENPALSVVTLFSGLGGTLGKLFYF